MKEIKFQPKLVGRYQDKIDEEKELWNRVISTLNDFIPTWNAYFGVKIELDELWLVLRQTDLPFFIKCKYVTVHPKHSEFVNSINVKIEEYIKFVEIPDFENLIEPFKEAKQAIKNWEVRGDKNWSPIIKDFSEFETWSPKIFINGAFEFTQELEGYLIQKHSVFTENIHQDYALHLIQEFCNSLNTMLNLGLTVNLDDIPISLRQCVDVFSTAKKYSELDYCNGGSKYCIHNFKPSAGFIKRDNSILRCVNNLSAEQIEEILKPQYHE